ncbi:MAG: LacI family DNA-binding transcriptional regulator [Asticcacaulis sp.]
MSEKKSARLEDLARATGVSISTVSRALNDSPSVNMRTKQMIWRAAKEMDYPFRSYMPSAPIGAEATIAVIFSRPRARASRLGDPFLFDLLGGVAEAARERGCDIVLSHVSPASLAEFSDAVETSRAEGLIILGQGGIHAALNDLARSERRFVVWGGQLPDQAYCAIGSDNPIGARRATAHLLRLGRQKLIFLGDTEAIEALQRYRGFVEAHDQAGLSIEPQQVVSALFEVESAEAAVQSLIQSDVEFDGIVAASDLIALGAIRAIKRSGRRVPQDVSVVGYDDVPFSRYASPALTTVSQDTAKAGRIMVSKLLEGGGLGVEQSERLPTELIIRESCGA